MEVADGGAEAETLHGTQVSPGGVQALVVACFSPALRKLPQSHSLTKCFPWPCVQGTSEIIILEALRCSNCNRIRVC